MLFYDKDAITVLNNETSNGKFLMTLAKVAMKYKSHWKTTTFFWVCTPSKPHIYAVLPVVMQKKKKKNKKKS